MKPILEVNGIRKSFGSTKVIEDISFRMNEGERICLLGPSGCGKSTLLQLVAGLHDVDAGSIHMAGSEVSRSERTTPPEERPINMVFQDYALWPHMTIRDNIEYGMKRRKVAAQERKKRLTALIELLHLDGLLGRMPAQLSGGQQQRVGIARALATEPKILLLDEPLSNLDVKLRTEMRTELAAMMRKLEITALYVTHDMMEAFALADRILVLNQGRIEQLAEPIDMFEAPATPWVAQLLGYHNRLTGTVLEVEGNEALVRCGDDVIRGVLSDHPGYRPKVRDEVSVLLHSGAFSLAVSEEDSRSRPDSGRLMNELTADVQDIVYEGDKWRYMLQAASQDRLQVLHHERFEYGNVVMVSFPAHRTKIYKAESKADEGSAIVEVYEGE